MVSPVVHIEDGRLRGNVAQDYLGNNYYSFLGIPYGKAPVGELRFKAPVPIEPWTEIKDATKEGAECPSRDTVIMSFIGSEDNCLNLNVFTPELPDNASKPLKPVMVWVHGGGFFYGSNRKEIFGPDYLITEDIVLVCINYRLGVFGFLSLEDKTLEVPGNAGLKDMILALKWVQKNIKCLGGDPNNVTIFGESAGGAAVHYLYLSPLSKGLFHKAIIQSGTALNCWARGSSNGEEIANNLGLIEKDEKKILEYLKTVSARTLVGAQHKTPDPIEPCIKRVFAPVIEEPSETAFLSEEPIEIIKSGRFNDVPLIIGYNSREGMFFEAVKHLEPTAKLPSNFESEIYYYLDVNVDVKKKAEIAARIKKFYFGDEQPSQENKDKLYLMKTDNLFLYDIYRSVSHHKLVSRSPIFFYRMTLESSLNYFKSMLMVKNIYLLMFLYVLIRKSGDGFVKNSLLKLAKLIPKRNHPGVCHADDIFYIFKTYLHDELKPESDEEMYVRRFTRLWANFAKTGNPTPEDDQLLNIRWPSVTKEENCLLNIGTELRMLTDPDSERIQFWEQICG